jgi:hypothetical protein
MEWTVLLSAPLGVQSMFSFVDYRYRPLRVD